MITNELAARMAEYVDYDRDTGTFRWAKLSPFNNCVKVGDLMGSLDSSGYLRLHILNHEISAHQMSWYLTRSEWPRFLIDHIDGIRTNNASQNLRASSVRLNGQNRTEHRNGHLVGASFDKRRNKWRAQIRIGKERLWLGYFATEVEAHEEYVKAIPHEAPKEGA